MANSRYEYVRSFEQPDYLLANTWIVVRIDGRGFSKLTTKYKFTKPNDRRALDLMNAAAAAVMRELPDLVLAYGNSDEFSFVFHKDCVLFERRSSKLMTTICSTFTSYYTFLWPSYFPDTPLTPPLPSFDGRCVTYPSDTNLRDYMSWRQVDCHINNLYNTTFWALVQRGGLDARTAEQELAGTVSSDKNEILFSRFGINYNNEPEIFKKGTVIYRDFSPPTSSRSSPTPHRTTDPPRPLAQPKPRQIARPLSQPMDRPRPMLHQSSSSSAVSTPRGPTFLSTSRTPSPPPSPLPPSMPAFPLPRTPVPVTGPMSPVPTTASVSKGPLPMLTPIPLPPPTLRPSTKPPPSLNPPNPTAQTNTSPLPSPPAPFEIPSRTTSNTSRASKTASHSASASLSASPNAPQRATAAAPKPSLGQRSPSLSILEFSPPQIPLRISSIPLKNQPRKLSLPSQKSFSTLNAEEKENAIPGGGVKVSPPIRTDKELPRPPIDDDSCIPADTSPAYPRNGNVSGGIEFDFGDVDPFRARREDRDTRRPRSHSYSRVISAPVSSYFPPISTTPPTHTNHASKPAPPSAFNASATALSPRASYVPKSNPQERERTYTPPKANSGKAKSKVSAKAEGKARSKAAVEPGMPEDGSWAAPTKGEAREGRPVEMSRTQREKDRKKRTKARIVIEHVDLIKDEFWETRPWLLSGRAG